MAAKTKPDAASRSRESETSMLSEFVRQGTESFFATQRILLDLATRQNTTTIDAVRERLENARTAPVAALTEMAGEGLSNFIAAQRVLLQLTQRQNDLLLAGIAERTDGVKPAGAMADCCAAASILSSRCSSTSSRWLRSRRTCGSIT